MCSLSPGRKTPKNTPWILDSRATDTMTNDVCNFTKLKNPQKTQVCTGNSDIIPVINEGSIQITPM